MSSARCLQPILRRATVRTAQPLRIAAATRRYAQTQANEPVLYSAYAKVVGARKGHVEGENLKVDLTMAKAIGGPGDAGKTNPEELFAAGYGACFQSAMNACAAQMGITMPTKVEDSIVESTVHLVGDMKKLDMGLRVDMKVQIKGMDKDKVEKIVARAKEVCPYSRATRGNVETNIEVIAFEGGSGGQGSKSQDGNNNGAQGARSQDGINNGAQDSLKDSGGYQ